VVEFSSRREKEDSNTGENVVSRGLSQNSQKVS
jgi:hypothetical protein